MDEVKLVKFDSARQALAEAYTIDEVKDIRDKMAALDSYLKQKGASLEMQNQCAEIRLRAIRKIGEILNHLKENGQLYNGVYNLSNTSSELHDDTPEKIYTLDELNLDKYESSRSQLIYSLPESIFEQEIETVKAKKQELTSSRMLKIARRQKAKEDKKTPPPINGKYRVLYADPPWKYGDSGLDDYGHAERHYPPMTITELCDLGDKIKDITESNAVLFLWTTSPLLEDAFKIIKAWGFEYKTSFVWDKVKHNHGHYNSVRHEFLLICTKGSCTPDVYKLFDSVQTIERTPEHSEKPEKFREIIDTLYTSGKKIELFARKKIEGWEAWGNECLD